MNVNAKQSWRSGDLVLRGVVRYAAVVCVLISSCGGVLNLGGCAALGLEDEQDRRLSGPAEYDEQGRRIYRRQRGFMADLPGATRGGQPLTSGGGTGLPGAFGGSDVPSAKLLQRDVATGKETLISTRPRHVMVHLALRLDDGKDDLFYDQLVSETTRQQFVSEGKDPRREVLNFLQTNYDDIMLLFARMPGAEVSPGVSFDRAGPSDVPGGGTQYRLRLTGTAAKGLKFTELWLEQSRGTWKFVWVR
ncbi:MAG: hypothetical protein IBJ18_06530 [Phycisphaerales bacterium]|nr:hypothetical protein [Phycisphaerales bacterium]